MSTTSLPTAKKIADWAFDKKAEDIVIMDMRDVVNFCDYFVICSANTDRQVKAIAEHLDVGLAEIGQKASYNHRDKKPEWIVMDVGDVIVHVFQKDIREFYQLEYLWQEAKSVKWEPKIDKK